MMETMEQGLSQAPSSPTMSGKDFSRLSELIYTRCGIKLPDVKKTMLEARLQKRIRALKLGSFNEYCAYLFSPKGMEEEFVPMVDLVTTNKTDFFREPDHFEYLIRTALPDLLNHYDIGLRTKLCLWSAGCSTGEEPYTIAMVVGEFGENHPGYRFSVIATDISTRVLKHGKAAIYEEERVLPVPLALKKKYLLRGKDSHKGYVKIAPGLRALVDFRRLNFMDSTYDIHEPIHVIFCRNVIIYFDRMTQERILQRLCRHLSPGGYIFMGHSEALHGMDLPLVQVAPTVYRRAS